MGSRRLSTSAGRNLLVGRTALPSVPRVIETALPVAVDLADPDLAADVCAHVESHLGWQVVQPGPHLRVHLRLADAVDPAVPTVVIAWHPPAERVRECMRAGALDVLAWPGDVSRLAGLQPTPAPIRPARVLLAVTAAARGVGASTVALALGALGAWAGLQTVVTTDEAGRHLAGITGPGRQPVAGIEGLSVAPTVRAAIADATPDVLVADLGVGRRGHVLVARPDRMLATALPQHAPTTTVVTVGTGALRPGERRRLLAGRPHVALDDSFRVARAGLRGRVPVGLPGRWLAALDPVAMTAVRQESP